MNGTLHGKTYVVTGATSGIGLAAVELLARSGANIIGTGRSREHCHQAKERLRALQPTGKIAWCAADLSEQAQVRRLADDIRKLLAGWKVSGLDGLLNNAATVPFWQTFSSEGYDTQWAVNHMAPFILTLNLLPILQNPPYARIVTVSSGSHFGASINWDDIQLLRHYSALRAYAQTKLCNVLFSAELNRRLADTNVHAFAADPGLVKTDIGLKSNMFLARWVWAIHSSGGISPEETAPGIVYLLTEPSIQNAGEVYWKHGKPKSPNSLALDENSGKRLWDVSLQMAGMKPGENPI